MLLKTMRLLPLLSLALTACSSIGPAGIKANRTDYNLAIQTTNDQELLLNIVRARYRDNMYFTTVERIAASQELLRSSNLGITAGALKNSPLVQINPATSIISTVQNLGLSLGPAAFAVNEKPTVFYAPIDGEKFVRQMMTPIKADILLLLIRSGWSIDRVLMLGVQAMNDLPNAPTASGPTPSYEPEFKAFQEVVHLLRKMQREHLLDIALDSEEKSIGIRFLKSSENSITALRIKSLLALDPQLTYFKFANETQKRDGKTVIIVTRPLIATINYLSQGVKVPTNDVNSGKVRATVQNDGSTPFDWQDLLDGVFLVQESQNIPESASVSIQYRGKWFYIADNDLDSKSTFMLLTQLIALHSTPPQSNQGMSYSINR